MEAVFEESPVANVMDSHKRLLFNNQAWVQRKLEARPDFFTRLADNQNPEILWIGCADSRVPAEEVTGADPGELFVHRNIANLVIHTDFNALSVIEYATEVLHVKHIIVCGHYNCGGIRTAMSHRYFGLINNWLRHVKDIYRLHAAELDAIVGEERRLERLCELNVEEQVHHLAQVSFVQRAWQKEGRPMLHGWVYDIHTGLLKDLIKVNPGQLPHPTYVYEFPED